MTNVDPLLALRPLREEEVEQIRTTHLSGGSTPLAYDVYRTGDEVVIEFDAPGASASDVSVAIEGRSIVVSLRRQMAKGPGVDMIECGRQHGTFSQRLWLGDRWNLEHLTARTEHGVLSVRAPLAARLASRNVHVATGSDSPSTSAAAEERSLRREQSDPDPMGRAQDGTVHSAA